MHPNVSSASAGSSRNKSAVAGGLATAAEGPRSEPDPPHKLRVGKRALYRPGGQSAHAVARPARSARLVMHFKVFLEFRYFTVYLRNFTTICFVFSRAFQGVLVRTSHKLRGNRALYRRQGAWCTRDGSACKICEPSRDRIPDPSDDECGLVAAVRTRIRTRIRIRAA